MPLIAVSVSSGSRLPRASPIPTLAPIAFSCGRLPLALRKVHSFDTDHCRVASGAERELLLVGHDRPAQLRHTRDEALLLLGFWRGFRGDELTRLHVEHVDTIPGEGMTCFLPRTKGDRANNGTTFTAPALARLCAVDAYIAWVELASLTEGPVFRGINRWGQVSVQGLHINSLVALPCSLFASAGITFAAQYSGHSLRRGFAQWATANGWGIKTLMEYVGWKNVQSALRYVEGSDPFARHRIDEANRIGGGSSLPLP